MYLDPNINEFPFFKKMKIELNKSLQKDKLLIKIIKKNFSKYKQDKFKFKVSISKNTYIRMIGERFISCLLNLSKKDIEKGLLEIQIKYKKKIKFDDTLKSLIYQN